MKRPCNLYKITFGNIDFCDIRRIMHNKLLLILDIEKKISFKPPFRGLLSLVVSLFFFISFSSTRRVNGDLAYFFIISLLHYVIVYLLDSQSQLVYQCYNNDYPMHR